MKKNTKYLDFFKNKDGKWSVIQFPNYLLMSWLFLTLMLLFIAENTLRDSVRQLSSAILFAWAYLEVVYGDSGFRRLFGVAILSYIVLGFFT